MATSTDELSKAFRNFKGLAIIEFEKYQRPLPACFHDVESEVEFLELQLDHTKEPQRGTKNIESAKKKKPWSQIRSVISRSFKKIGGKKEKNKTGRTLQRGDENEAIEGFAGGEAIIQNTGAVNEESKNGANDTDVENSEVISTAEHEASAVNAQTNQPEINPRKLGKFSVITTGEAFDVLFDTANDLEPEPNKLESSGELTNTCKTEEPDHQLLFPPASLPVLENKIKYKGEGDQTESVKLEQADLVIHCSNQGTQTESLPSDECKSLKIQINLLQENINALKAKHKQERKLREPLFQVGIKVRRRFMELTKRLNRGGTLTDIRGKVDHVIVEEGNEAAHRGNVMADSSMFLLKIFTAETDIENFKAIYNAPPSFFSSQGYLSGPSKQGEMISLYGTMKSCLSGTQYTLSKTNDQRFFSLVATCQGRIKTLRSEMTKLTIAEQSKSIEKDAVIEKDLVEMRQIVEDTVKADKRRNRG